MQASAASGSGQRRSRKGAARSKTSVGRWWSGATCRIGLLHLDQDQQDGEAGKHQALPRRKRPPGGDHCPHRRSQRQTSPVLGIDRLAGIGEAVAPKRPAGRIFLGQGVGDDERGSRLEGDPGQRPRHGGGMAAALEGGKVM